MKYLLLLLPLLASACVPFAVTPVSRMNEIAYPYPVKKATLPDGVEIAYMDEGQGPVLLMIHGLGSYGPAWKKNMEVLKSSYRCIAVDLPGYGHSSKGDYPIDMKYFARQLQVFLQQLGIEKATWVGHSMGGQISITAALYYPQAVERLILAAPAGFETFTEGEKQWFREALTAESVKKTPTEQLVLNFYDNFFEFPEDAAFMISDRLAMRKTVDFDWYCTTIPKCVQGMVNQPVFDFLGEIKQPTLVVFGQQDNLIPNRFMHGGFTRTVMEQGAAKIPGARLVPVDKAGHFVQFEQPEAFNAAVTSFMEGK